MVQANAGLQTGPLNSIATNGTTKKLSPKFWSQIFDEYVTAQNGYPVRAGDDVGNTVEARSSQYNGRAHWGN